jgi:acyl-CoA thioester hydrolase
MTRRRKSDDVAAAAAPATPRARRKRSDTAKPAGAIEPANAVSAMLIRVPVEVRWRDLDAFSHVNNSTFLTYVEEARLQWFQSLPGPWLSEDVAPVLAATHVNYRRPIEWPAHLVVELFAERVGSTSLTVAHRITALDDASRLYADGHSVLVWIDRHDGRPAPLPDAVRGACSAPA